MDRITQNSAIGVSWLGVLIGWTSSTINAAQAWLPLAATVVAMIASVYAILAQRAARKHAMAQTCAVTCGNDPEHCPFGDDPPDYCALRVNVILTRRQAARLHLVAAARHILRLVLLRELWLAIAECWRALRTTRHKSRAYPAAPPAASEPRSPL